MSNQFSYELDERQIRILMLNSEADYNENAWQRFESTITNTSSIKVLNKAALPKLNLSISRSFIIPVLFIGLIGGLSILLFSFVDFKKKEEVIIEKPLEISKPAAKPKSIAAKPIINPKTEPAVVLTNSVTVPIKSTKSNVAVILPEKKETVRVVETPKNNDGAIENVVPDSNTPQVKKMAPKHKKKRKMVVEELPAITTPAILNSSSEEPELDLK